MATAPAPVPTSESNEKQKAAVVSLLAALGLTLLKLAVGLTTNSLGILSEALHSGLDLLAAAMTLLAVRIAAKPADQGHPYGHGKVENLSALGQTLLLFLTCVWVVHEGVTRLLAGASPVTPSLWGVGVMAVSMAVDINRVRILRRVARRYKSQALEADALHFSTDILSSAVVLAGVLAVWLAAALRLPEPLHRMLAQADTVAALLVAVIIFRASLHMAATAVNTLMDSGSAEAQQGVIRAVQAVPGIAEVRRARVRVSGPQSFVDLTWGLRPACVCPMGTVWPTRRKWPWLGCCPARTSLYMWNPPRCGVRAILLPWCSGWPQSMALPCTMCTFCTQIRAHALSCMWSCRATRPYAQAYARVGTLKRA